MGIAGKVFAAIRRAVVVFFLCVLYFVGFGAVALYVLIFRRDFLKAAGREERSFWKTAEGYRQGQDELAQQS